MLSHFSWRAKGRLLSLIGLSRYAACLEFGNDLVLRLPPWRKRIEGNLRRVRSFQGLPTSADDVQRHRGALAALHAEIQATLALFASVPSPPILDEVELPLLPALRRLGAAGRGVLLAAPHYGNLWLCAKALDRAGVPLACVLNDPAPYRWGETPTLRVLPRRGSSRACLGVLRRNRCVLLTADMSFDAKAPRHPFFGYAVSSPRNVVRLSALAGSPILPVCAVRRGGRWSFECRAGIDPRSAGRGAMEEDLLRSMESFVAADPSQWLLLHDAWR